MGTPTGDLLRAASAYAGMAVEASAEAAGLRKRVAELESELDERLAAVQLCDIYYKIGCDALGQDEWDRRVREALTK
jgi:hypothetical protein